MYYLTQFIYEEAANLGNAEGMYNLALMYSKGITPHYTMIY